MCERVPSFMEDLDSLQWDGGALKFFMLVSQDTGLAERGLKRFFIRPKKKGMLPVTQPTLSKTPRD